MTDWGTIADEGAQLTISLFGIRPAADGAWVAEIGRHRTLDTPDPRLRPA